MSLSTHTELLPHIKIETKPNPDATVIWLHGLGADGHDFEPIVPELKLPESAAVRFIFPHAPSIPVTINNGYVMPAWYDILEMSIDRKVDVAQLTQSSDAIKSFIHAEIDQGIASERIVIAGFSQGGAVAIESALTFDKPLAGLLALSTYFATRETIQPSHANSDIPVQIYHGTADPVVPVQLSQVCYEQLKSLGYQPEIDTYPMQHNVCMEEIAAISAWLQRVLNLSV